MRQTLIPMLLAFLTAACASLPQATPAPQQIFVVRHFEKAAGDDPALTSQGRANAVRLADQLSDKGISAIFATATTRTLQSAAPLARRLGAVVDIYDPAQPEPLTRAILASPGSALIVGHSNTVPDLVERLGGERPAPMAESDYGAIFRILPRCGRTDRFRVGEAVPAVPAGC